MRTKNSQLFVPFVFVLLISGCAELEFTKSLNWEEITPTIGYWDEDVQVDQAGQIPVSIKWADDRSSESIIVRAENPSRKKICFDNSSWPDDDGRIFSGGGRPPELIVDGKSYFIPRVEQIDYCLWDFCSTEVPPGRVLRIRFAYARFGLPADKFDDRKQLVMDISQNVCYWGHRK